LNVTDGFFAALGVAPFRGRVFEPGDDRPAAPRAVVVSYGLWQRRFHGDSSIVGRQIVLDGEPHAVVGVMPAGFSFLDPDYELFRVMPIAPPARRGPFYTSGLGRLRPDVTIEQATEDLAAVARTIKERYPGPGKWQYELVPLKRHIVGDTTRVLYLLFGAVVCLLLIATVNVANLLLVRTASREREIAVRGALGAGSGRIVAHLVTESLVLASASGALGLLAAFWGTKFLLQLAPAGNIPRIEEVGVRLPVFVFAFALAALSGVAFSLAPSLRATRVPLVDSLAGAGRGGSTGPKRRRMQRALAASEIALSLMLSVGAALMVRSLALLERVDPGFAPERLLTLQVSLPAARYGTPQAVESFFDRLRSALESLPSVQSVGFSVSLPPDLNAMTDTFTVEGQAMPANEPAAPLLFVDEGYFRTLGVPLVAGRAFDERDTVEKPPVAIVNESLARRYFPQGAAVGKRLKEGGSERPDNPYMEIVGVVGDVKYEGLDAPPEPTLYLSDRQSRQGQARRFVIVRSGAEARAIAPALRAAVGSLDPGLAVARVHTMDQLMADSVAPPRFRTTIVTAFAVAGLFLAAIGVYGVMAYAVADRTHELGLRVALGASKSDVLRLVLSETAAIALAGVLIGLAGAAAGARLIASLLFGVGPTDPWTFGAVAALLVAAALAASYLPARRAMRLDPMQALRAE
jgi:putative ABC transport system permease protein